MMAKRIAVLGATGSIGKNTLDVIRALGSRFEPVLFSAHSDEAGLRALAAEFPNAKMVLSGAQDGRQRLLDGIACAEAELTVNGISGAAGLEPSFAALDAGSALALANKESIVMAGPLLLARAEQKGLAVIPVDSEHSAIFNLLRGTDKSALKEILLTASGGPFRLWDKERLSKASIEDALAHPTWSMGAKITIDSASLANKGLELIEAARLFGVDAEHIKVVIHPQSIVHSMIRMNDGAVYAQLSRPDMRLPIHEALCYPEIAPSPWGELDFDTLNLSFEKPDFERFPMLAYAYDALRHGGRYPIAYNAANEAAVAAFIQKKITFLEISAVCRYVLDKDWTGEASCLPSILETDREARRFAEEWVLKPKGFMK
jgi:1-deoxy-D-xylulose-5-phosphate reductoisomerase